MRGAKDDRMYGDAWSAGLCLPPASCYQLKQQAGGGGVMCWWERTSKEAWCVHGACVHSQKEESLEGAVSAFLPRTPSFFCLGMRSPERPGDS